METFTTIYKNELIKLINSKIKDNCNSEKIEYSKGQYRIKFDGYIEKDNKIIILEIEFRRSDPQNNLLKTIHWLAHSLNKKTVHMIHIFDDNYYSLCNNRFKREVTLFLAKRIKLLGKKFDAFCYTMLNIGVDKNAYRRRSIKEARALTLFTLKKIINKIK